MRIFVLGDSFADNLFAEAYYWIHSSENNTTGYVYHFSPIQRYLMSMKEANIDKAKWFTDWLQEWGYEVVNLGKGGCSNQNIFYQFAQIDKEFRDGDRIIINWTDHCRFDWAMDEQGHNISVHPIADGFQEPLRSIFEKHSVCIDESFKSKFGYLYNYLIPFMDWIVEKHSNYNPILWSVFPHTIKNLDKSRYFNVQSPYFLSFLENKWNIRQESGGLFDDGHFGRYGNYYLAVLFDEIIKSEFNINFNEEPAKSHITKSTLNRIKNENVIFKNPPHWDRVGLEKFT
jgi:hypothetical protein